MAKKNDFLKQRTEARAKSESVQSSDTTPLGTNEDGTVTRASNFIRKKAAQRREIIDKEYGPNAYGGSGRYEADMNEGFNSWLQDVSTLSDRLSQDYAGRQGSYQAADAFDKYRRDNDASISVLQNRANAYRNYFSDNASMYDEEKLKEAMNALDQYSSYLSAAQGDLGSEYDFWAQFQDQNAYDQYQKYLHWQDVPNAADFEEKSAYHSTYNPENEKFNAWSGTYTDTGFGDVYYDYINGDEKAQSRTMVNDVGAGGPGSLYSTTHDYWKDLPEDVVKTFNYIYATEGADAAYDYIGATIQKTYTGIEALGFGAMQGMGTSSLSAALGKAYAGITGDEEAGKRTDDWYNQFLQESAAASAEHPNMAAAGQITGTLGLMTTIASGVGAINGFSSLPGIAQSIISGGASLGGTTAVQGIGNAATGNQSWGDYAADVGISTASGAAGGALSNGLGTWGTKFLQGKGLAGNQLARAVVAGISGSGFVAGSNAITQPAAYLRDPENYEFDAEKFTEEALVGFAFAAFGYLSKNYTTDPGTAAQMDADDALVDKYFKGMTPEEATKAYRQYARQYHPDLYAGSDAATQQAMTATMAEVNAAYARFNVTHGAASYQAAQEARANGDTTAYEQAASEFQQSASALQAAAAESGAMTAEAAEAAQILNTVAAGMSGGMAGEAITGVNEQLPQEAGTTATTAQEITTQLVSAGVEPAEAESLGESMAALMNGEEISGNKAGAIAETPEAISILENATGQQINTDAPLSEVKNAIRGLASRTEAREDSTVPVSPATEEMTFDDAMAAFNGGGKFDVINHNAVADDVAAGTLPAALSQESETPAQPTGIDVVRDFATTLDKAGSKALESMYNDGQDAAAYVKEMMQEYSTGRSGSGFTGGSSHTVITSAQAEAAYIAGQADAAASGSKSVAPALQKSYTVGRNLSPARAKSKGGAEQASQTLQIDAAARELKTVEDEIEALHRSFATGSVTPEEYRSQLAQYEPRYQAAKENYDRLVNEMPAPSGEAKEGITNGRREETGRNPVRQGSKRNVPQRESGKPGSVSAGTEAVRAGWELSGVPKDGQRESLRYEEKVNPDSFLPEAKKGQTVYRDASDTESVRASHSLADKNGLKLEAWGGGEISVSSGGQIRAFAIPGTDRIGVQTDNPEVAGDDLTRHEIMEQKILRGEVSVDEVLSGAERYADPGKIQAAVEFYYRGYPSEGLSHARSELVCDGADHINQLRYDVEHGNLGGEFTELADVLDEVIEAINRTANELTGGAFELDTEPGTTAYSEKIKEGGNGQKAGIGASGKTDGKNASGLAAGGRIAGDIGRGIGKTDSAVSERKIGYADRSREEQDKLSEILITPIDNDAEWCSFIRGYSLHDITGKICDSIDSGNQIIAEWEKAVPGFREAVSKARDYAGRKNSARNTGAMAGAVSAPKTDSKGRALSTGQQRYFSESAVRDEAGRLLTLYHGSRYQAFDVFDLYEGVWLTPDREYAKIYAENIGDDVSALDSKVYDNGKLRIYELYANIKNPLDLGEVNAALTPEKVRELAANIGAPVRELEEISRHYMQEDIYSLTRSHEFMELAAKYHFDGLTATEDGHRTFCAIDNPNQAKQTSNKNPSEKPSTRFSMKTPVEETRDLIAVHNMTYQNLDDALKLGGLPSPSIAIVKAEQGHTKYGPISLIFEKSTIDPEANGKNKVYGGDAFTPTAPQVDYPVDYDVMRAAEKKIGDLAKNVAGGIFSRGSVIRSIISDDSSSMSTQELASRLANNDAVRAAYLADKGETLEPVMTQKEYDNFGNEALQSYINKIGHQELARQEAAFEAGEHITDEQMRSVQDVIREDYRRSHESYLMKRPELMEKRLDMFIENRGRSPFRLEDFIRHAWEYYQDGGTVKDTVDPNATREALVSRTESADVQAWVEKQLDGMLGEPGIYNGKDPFKPSGESRDFGELHYSYTLENIVRAMNSTQAARGQSTFGVGASAMLSVSTPEYKSIQQIKADSGRLQTVDDDAYKEMEQKLDDEIGNAIRLVRKGNRPHSDNEFEETDIIGTVMMDAAQTKQTVDAIVKTFAKEGYKISNSAALAIQKVFKEAAAFPTGYFEAKPQRAVGFQEVRLAIVPDTMDASLRKRLEDAGVQEIQEYSDGDDTERIAKANSAQGARFSSKVPAVVYNGTVVLKKDTVDTYLRDYAAPSSPHYAQAYIAHISPADFLRLTTSVEGRDRIVAQSRDLDVDELARSSRYQPLQLHIDHKTGEVTGHEGRHRAVALDLAGVRKIPVLFFDSSNKYDKTDIGKLTLIGQDFGRSRSNARVTVHSLSPFNYANRDEILERFAKQPTVEKISENYGYKTVSYSDKITSFENLKEENRALREKLEELKGADAQAGRMEKKAAYWQSQTRRTKEPSFRQGDVDKLAKSIIKSFGSTLSAQDISADVKALGEFIMRGGDGNDELTWAAVKDRASAIARDVVENAEQLVTDGEAETFREIKSYLHGTKLSYEDKGDIADYNDFRKRNFGRFTIAKGGLPVDVAYDELASTFGEGYFPADITHPTDQLLHISDLLDNMQPIYENPHSAYMAEAIEYCANEIIDGLLDESVRQTPPTFADRQAAKLDAQKAKGRQQIEALREQKNERISEVRSAESEKRQKQLAKLREEKNARISEIRAAGRERTRQAIEQESSRRKEQISNLKAHYREVAESRRGKAADSKARTRLLKIARRLNNKKLPAVSRDLIRQYIGELDLVSKSMTGKTLDKLTDLREWYEDQRDNNPDFISDPSVEKMLQRLAKKQIGDMTAAEVEELTNVLLNIENEIRTQNKLIHSADRRDTYAMGVQAINDITDSRGVGEGLWGGIDRLFINNTLSPVREIRRMTGYVDTDPLYTMMNELADGQRTMFDYQRRAGALFKKWTEDKPFVKRIAGKHAAEIEIAGISAKGPVRVKITPAMRMSLYLHSLNDQNLRHIAGGGVTVPDMKLYKQGKISASYNRGVTIKLTPSEVRAITAGMSEKERAFSLAANAYYNGMSRDTINATSEALKGYSLASVENYFPIDTDKSFLKTDFDTVKFDGTIEGMGFLKERVNASGPIMLYDMNSVLTKSIDQHAKYAGLAIPIRNFNKVWGVTKGSFNEDGSRNNFESSVQQAVKQKWGDAGYKYIEKLMTDLQKGGKDLGDWDRLMNRVRSNYAGAVLTLNASVAMKQAASYPTAGAVVGFKALARAMTDFGKVDLDLIAKYTPLLWYRSQGFSTQELGDMAKQGVKLPAILNWVQGVDVLTTRKLWKAAEYYVRQNRKDLKRGSEEYYRAVADVYNHVIEETQPNYTTMQRPQLLRSESTLLQNLSMFKTQPFQNFNILYDAIGNLDAKRRQYTNSGSEESRKSYQEAKKKAAWAIFSQLMQLAVFAGMTAAWNLFRGKNDNYSDKETGELTAQSVLSRIGRDMLGSQFSTIPFGSDVWELASSLVLKETYYGFDDVTASAIDDLFGSLKKAGQSITAIWESVGSGEKIDWNEQRLQWDSVIDASSKVAGVPYENVTNLFNAVYRRGALAANGKYKGTYAYLRLTTSPEKYSGDYYNNLYDAYVNDQEAYRQIYADMIASGDFEAGKIKSAMESRMKKDQGVEKAEDLESRYLPPDQQKVYDRSASQIKRSDVWRQADAEQRDDVMALLYGLASGSNDAGSKSAREKISEGADVGLSQEEYLLYKLALSMTDKPTESGKLGSYTNDETEEAIRMLEDLTDAERDYLWAAQGKNEKSTPRW